MGVPRFFKWLIDHYPENKIILPDLYDLKIDRLFLDANGLFHPQCFKALALYGDYDTDKLEQKMRQRILRYIDFLFDEVKPTSELFISVDGVAPLAKMNQQRKRRFRSVDDNALRKEIKRRHGVEEKNPWSNIVITPGTEFMERLMSELKRYAQEKAKATGVKVTLSDYHEAGEGEHKIISYIRELSRAPATAGEKYVINGLDADLIFLSLATHHPNIYLMRETVQMGKVGQGGDDNFMKDPEDVDEEMNYIHVDEMKQCYLEHLESMIESQARHLGLDSFEIEEKEGEGLLTDFIFICYLLGNDFLPHIPSLGISHGGLDRILKGYAELYLTSGKKNVLTLIQKEDEAGNLITHDVRVEMPQLIQLVNTLAEHENTYFRYELPKFERKRQKMRCWSSDPLERDLWNLEFMKCFKIEDPVKFGFDTPEMWKHRYYEHYFKISGPQTQLIETLCLNYVQGLVWVAMYYFAGCVSWDWQYRYTHAPLLSDLAQYLSELKCDLNEIKFPVSEPLPPCTQLLAVLPSPCSQHLPYQYRTLVTHPRSPIADLYPKEIKLDMLHHMHYWECVPFLPAVNPLRLRKAVEDRKLSSAEQKRNISRVAPLVVSPRVIL